MTATITTEAPSFVTAKRGDLIIVETLSTSWYLTTGPQHTRRFSAGIVTSVQRDGYVKQATGRLDSPLGFRGEQQRYIISRQDIDVPAVMAALPEMPWTTLSEAREWLRPFRTNQPQPPPTEPAVEPTPAPVVEPAAPVAQRINEVAAAHLSTKAARVVHAYDRGQMREVVCDVPACLNRSVHGSPMCVACSQPPPTPPATPPTTDLTRCPTTLELTGSIMPAVDAWLADRAANRCPDCHRLYELGETACDCRAPRTETCFTCGETVPAGAPCACGPDDPTTYECRHACPYCQREWTHQTAKADGCDEPYFNGPCPGCPEAAATTDWTPPDYGVPPLPPVDEPVASVTMSEDEPARWDAWCDTVALDTSPAYQQGRADCLQYGNGPREQYPAHPYRPGTREWLAYNRGWNTTPIGGPDALPAAAPAVDVPAVRPNPGEPASHDDPGPSAESSLDPAVHRYRQHVDALRANDARALTPLLPPVMGGSDEAEPITIELTRAEGRTEECCTITLNRLEAAYSVLIGWSTTAPERGQGYHKTDFTIRWPDGLEYRGRYDLQRGVPHPTLVDAVRAELQYAEQMRAYIPVRVTPDEAATFLARLEQAERAEIAAMVTSRPSR